MKVRRYIESDLEPLVQIFVEAVHVGAARHYDAAQRAAWAPIPPDLSRWRCRFESVCMLVAEEDGRAIGFLSYELDGHIDMLFTSPAHTRRGIASELYRQAESSLLAHGVHELFTEASYIARPFFEKHGFVVEEQELVTRNGVVLPRFNMRKHV